MTESELNALVKVTLGRPVDDEDDLVRELRASNQTLRATIASQDAEAVMLRDITARQKRIIATLEASIASLETIAGLTNVAQLQNMEKY